MFIVRNWIRCILHQMQSTRKAVYFQIVDAVWNKNAEQSIHLLFKISRDR